MLFCPNVLYGHEDKSKKRELVGFQLLFGGQHQFFFRTAKTEKIGRGVRHKVD